MEPNELKCCGNCKFGIEERTVDAMRNPKVEINCNPVPGTTNTSSPDSEPCEKWEERKEE